jgi:hypothetical protein
MAKRIEITSTSSVFNKENWEQVVRAGLKLGYKPSNPFNRVLAYVDRRVEKAHALTRTRYVEMLTDIQHFLEEGVVVSNRQLVDPASEQQYAVRFRKGGILKSGRMNDVSWRGLPKDYIAITRPKGGNSPGSIKDPYGIWKGLPKPKGRPIFWKKTGRLGSTYSAWLKKYKGGLTLQSFSFGNPAGNAYAFHPSREHFESGRKGKTQSTPLAMREDSRVRIGPSSSVVTVGRGRSLYSLEMRIKPPDMGNPALYFLLGGSFFSTRAQKYKVDTARLGKPRAAPLDVSRIAYPEFRRPILSRYAAQAGKKYREDLANFLKNR